MGSRVAPQYAADVEGVLATAEVADGRARADFRTRR
jgi:hypothetical protein